MKRLTAVITIVMLAMSSAAFARDGAGGGEGNGAGDSNGRAHVPLETGVNAANGGYASGQGPSAVLVLQLVFGTGPDTNPPSPPPQHDDDDCMSCP